MNIKQIIKRAGQYIIHGVPEYKTTAQIVISDDKYSLHNQNIVITGGTKGLGYAMAKKFLQSGAQVLITGRDKAIVSEVANELGCKFEVLDISNPDNFEIFIKNCEDKIGPITTLVNNAGISLHEKDFFDVSPETFDAQINTNLRGTFFLTQVYIKYLISHHLSGNVLVISSETGETVDNRPYGYTKAALNSFVKGLAYQFRKKNIRINAIAPGICTTEMTGRGNDGNIYSGEYGCGRYYLPEEIAEVAKFLISKTSNCISGQIITCNNAQTVNPRQR